MNCWIHNGRDSVSLSERPSNHALFRKGFAMHLLMRNSGRRGRRVDPDAPGFVLRSYSETVVLLDFEILVQ